MARMDFVRYVVGNVSLYFILVDAMFRLGDVVVVIRN
jgi:hypothetical protein